MLQRVTTQLARPGVWCCVLVISIVAVLGADRHVDAIGQLALGAVTWLLLIGGIWRLPRREQLLVLTVVAVATCAEVFASVIWGVYVYRLENVPAFVPPGHGMVYLGGLQLSRLAAVQRWSTQLRLGALAIVSTWAVAGITVLERPDLLGALGLLLLVPILLTRRHGTVYVGVVLFVALVEVWGTSVGAWTWAATVPYTSVSAGNPPSGVAAGYVVIEAAAVALATLLLRVLPLARGLSTATGNGR